MQVKEGVVAAAVQFRAKGEGTQIFAQTPTGQGYWKDLRFISSVEDCGADWLVIYDDPGTGVKTCVPLQRRIIFLAEPPAVKDYYSHFINQFGVVVSPMPIKGFKGVWLQQHGALVWFFGASFDELWAADYDAKQNDLSVVCSSARKFEAHRSRFEFVSKLKEILGDRLHWYGRGIHDLPRKANAIIPYRYSIAIENNAIEHFWTEKLADIYLGHAFPFYSGGANIGRYFDERTFETIDISDPVGAAKKIERTIESGIYEERLPLIREARRKIMEDYNLFNETWKIVTKLTPMAGKVPRLAKAQAIASRKAGVRSWVLDQPRRVRRTLEWLEHRY
jgi:hypothetical protein